MVIFHVTDVDELAIKFFDSTILAIDLHCRYQVLYLLKRVDLVLEVMDLIDDNLV